MHPYRWEAVRTQTDLEAAVEVVGHKVLTKVADVDVGEERTSLAEVVARMGQSEVAVEDHYPVHA